MIRNLSIFIILLFACGRNESDPKKSEHPSLNLDATQPSSSLVFAGIDPRSFPWKSSLYTLDLKTHQIQKILSGESSDPILFQTKNFLYFFNRTLDSKNFRTLSFENGEIKPGPQTQFPQGTFGDPHSVLELDEKSLLLAHYSSGQLTLMDAQSGKLRSNLTVPWNLPADIQLKPERLISFEDTIFVLHQGLGTASHWGTLNGSQQIFVLEKTASNTLIPVNQLQDPDKVHGIKLTGSVPVSLVWQGWGKSLMVSLCSQTVSTIGRQPNNQPCINAIEEFDFKTQTLNTLWDFSGHNIYMNGPIIAGENPDIFYANVERFEGQQSYKELVKVIVSLRRVETIHTFEKDSGGFWGVFFDHNSKTLYIGDQTTSGGKMTIMQQGGSTQEITLETVPYSGVFVHTKP